MSPIEQIVPSNKILVRDLKRQVSNSEFIDLVNVAYESQSDIHPRDIIWLECRNTIETLVQLFALWQRGACVVPIDPQLGQSEKDYLYQEIPPNKVVMTSEKNDYLTSVKPVECKNTNVLDAAVIQLSSGSTGQPKVILISLKAILSRAMTNRDHLQLNSNDRTLCSVPLSHSHGIDCLALPTLFANGTLFLTDPATSFPYRILELIEKEQITFFSSLPQMYNYFNQAALNKSYNLSSLRHAFCGSAALSESTALDFNKLFSLHLKQGYGLAEIGVICVNLKTEANKYASIGEPIPGIDWFLKPDGELCVKSEALFSGYYKQIAATNERMDNGYLLTEDLVTIDDSGYFYITGRKNDFININGMKVFPKEVEKTVLGFAEIKEYCVTAEPDPTRGQIPVLHLVAKESELDRALFEKNYFDSLIGQIEEFKFPRKIVWHLQLPKSPLGKILKSKL